MPRWPPRCRSASKSIVVGCPEACPIESATRPRRAARGRWRAAARRRCRPRRAPASMSASSVTTSRGAQLGQPGAAPDRPDLGDDVAPASAASWTANRPTPPDAPVTSTRRPSSGPSRRTACSAVTPAPGSAAAATRSDPVGHHADVRGGHRAQRGQRAAHRERADPGADRRPGPVGRGRDDDAGGVLPGHAANPVHGVGVGQIEEVERGGGHRDQGFAGHRVRVGQLRAAQRRGAEGSWTSACMTTSWPRRGARVQVRVRIT